jgi:predicted CXXCH cytochrome family protein
MRTGSLLLSVAASVLAATAWVAASREVQLPAGPAAPGAAAIVSRSADFVGSEACQSCHQEAYAKWQASLHVQMTRPIAAATVLGDFSGRAAFTAHGRAYTFSRGSGAPTITVRAGDRPAETFRVDYTLGSKRFQGYLSTLPDGRMYVLPVFWHVESGRWLDWKETTPIPDGAHDLRQMWNVNCFNCHATNLDRGYQPATATYRTHWTELGIGCEACHGPGREHIALTEGWARDPASMPRYSSRASNRQLSDTLKIFSPRSADPRRTFDSCAYCHGNKRNLFTTFAAGDRYEDHALPFLLSDPLSDVDAQGEFWPDGRPNRFNRPQALTLSGCFKAGAVTCTSCHVAHGSPYDFSLKVDVHDGRAGDQLCTQCHQSPPATPVEGAAPLSTGTRPRVTSRPADGPDSRIPWTDAQIAAHSFHDAASAGSRCVNCHMSDVNWRLLMRRRDHTFQPPVPETTVAFGVPNACTTCHDDKPPEWAARQMDAWWGDGARRAKSARVATTMYRAGSGDAMTVPQLASIALDRTQGAVLRASAVEYIGGLLGGRAADAAIQSQTATSRSRPDAPAARPAGPIDPRAFGALLGAASDPEPMVRAAAVRTLGVLDQRDERALAVLMARVVDTARVVRSRAAEALLLLDVVTAPGRAGEALSRAQIELAESLRSVPESASQQATLAWLLAQRGEAAAAEEAVRAAIALDARFARPHVIRGVLAARAGRFDDALASWRRARALDPATPNIDRMIEEAQRRAAPPRGH